MYMLKGASRERNIVGQRPFVDYPQRNYIEEWLRPQKENCCNAISTRSGKRCEKKVKQKYWLSQLGKLPDEVVENLNQNGLQFCSYHCNNYVLFISRFIPENFTYILDVNPQNLCNTTPLNPLILNKEENGFLNLSFVPYILDICQTKTAFNNNFIFCKQLNNEYILKHRYKIDFFKNYFTVFSSFSYMNLEIAFILTN